MQELTADGRIIIQKYLGRTNSPTFPTCILFEVLEPNLMELNLSEINLTEFTVT
jgi:hypothetical protein